MRNEEHVLKKVYGKDFKYPSNDLPSVPETSEREKILNKLVEVLQKKGLDEVYGIQTGLADNKKYRYATFCRARTLDGEVKVYGSKFIQIKWQRSGRWGNEVCRSLNEAKEFLEKTF